MTQDLEPPDVPDPWARHGWLLAGIWLVFLGFPAAGIIDQTADRPVVRVVMLGVIVAFAVLYVLAFIRGQEALYSGWTPALLWWVFGGFAGLVAMMFALGTELGVNAVGVSPFLAALAAFCFPWRWAPATVVAVTVACAVVLLLGGQLGNFWPVVILPALIGGFGLLLRRLTASDEKRQTLQRSLAVSAERDRVARDVHDVLGHSLTVVSLKADLAERLVDLDPERAKGEIADIRSVTRQSLAEIRATVAGLRITRLTDERETAASALRDAGIEAEFPEDGEIVDPAHRITLAWVLRETTTNVIRHSGADRVEVAWGPSWLEVTDDGHGLRGRREGSGLTGVRERVVQAGGRVEVGDGITGTSGPGTKVRVELP